MEEEHETAAAKERSRRIKSYGSHKEAAVENVENVQEDVQENEEDDNSDQESIATVEQNVNFTLFNLDNLEMIDEEDQALLNSQDEDEELLNFDGESEQDSEQEQDDDDDEMVQDATQDVDTADALNEIESNEEHQEEEEEQSVKDSQDDDSQEEENEFVVDSTQQEEAVENKEEATQQEEILEEESTPEPESQQKTPESEITNQDILSCVETLFEEADKETMTVKDIINSCKEILQIKIKGERKALIKEHLMKLVNAQEEEEEEVEETEEQEEAEEAEESEYDASDEEETKKRPTRTPKKRKPSHLKIHHESMRKRQLQQQKVLQEELQQAQAKKISQADRERAEAIAKKFQTDSEELRLKRAQERLGLIDTLVKKRLMLLNSDGEDSSEDSESDEESSEDELEILGMDSKPTDNYEADSEDDSEELTLKKDKTSPKGIKRIVASPKKNSPQSIIAFFSHSTSNYNNNQTARNKVVKNPRALLKHALKAKQFENGNKWLARELGYDKVEDHIRECNMLEMKKKKQLKALEQQRIMNTVKKGLSAMEDVKTEDATAIDTDAAVKNEEEEETMERTRVNLDQESDQEQEEEDEEMAMAREIAAADAVMEENMEEDEVEKEESMVNDFTQTVMELQDDLETKEGEATSEEVIPNAPTAAMDNVEESMVDDSLVVDSTDAEANPDPSSEDKATEEDEDDGEAEAELEDDVVEAKPKKDRNAAWKAMLEKEKAMLKKQKANKSGLVEAEAEEEEDEEGVAGLEDFGFTVDSKKKSEDEENEEDNANDDDFENIVDDVSDNEGDEEAGEAARKALAQREEKLRHKEIIRRMRDGYDGRRGGIAGGSGARGNIRFDELVAADNKEAAKRLGLANDDEFDSDDDAQAAKGESDNEIEDEAALVDKMLKDRYLNRTEIPAEDFTDSEDEEENEEDKEAEKNSDDEEDAEQENLAKRFARRARMNRLIALHGDDKEFSQGRRLETDKQMQEELKSIRVVHSRTKRQTSFASSYSGESSQSGFPSRFNSNSNLGPSQSSILSTSSTLAIAIQKSKGASKRKTGFLGTAKQDGKSKKKAGGISFGGVFFGSEPSQASNMSRSNSATLPQKRKTHFAGNSQTVGLTSAKKKSKSSLWSRVSASGFKKKGI
ncbi:hypothetical protein CTEN210_18561 [Chaetoceros tenuissimus]|uniref:DNA replication checkpoint mediator MRC1 domain-containing protein n=1 Tax=Chaetoceros tenuissimus TaxID=426638 RepID=A0AAD3DEU4_9STRA|nr:hypothetical protein CTEN210_18561 [Chaetoceros tenuissimus]